MKRLLLLSVILFLAGCGGFKNTDPLSGLAGADNAIYTFETGTQGWACAASQGGTCNSVSQATNMRFAGQACLQVLLNGMNNNYIASGSPCPGPDGAARASVVLGAGGPDLTGRTVRAWVYIPSSAQYSKDAPTQAQIFMVQNTGSLYANGPGVNLIPGTWNEVSYAPVANPLAVTATAGGGSYMAASFTPTTISELGVKISPSGSAPCSFSYTGYVLIDSVNY